MAKEWTWDMGIETRIALRVFLAQCRGSYAEQMLADAITKAALDEDEQKARNFRTEGSTLLWDSVDEKGKPLADTKPMKFGPEARDFITRNLAMLDEARALERVFVSLYELFIKTPWPEPE